MGDEDIDEGWEGEYMGGAPAVEEGDAGSFGMTGEGRRVWGNNRGEGGLMMDRI